jgi:hypothetical protein
MDFESIINNIKEENNLPPPSFSRVECPMDYGYFIIKTISIICTTANILNQINKSTKSTDINKIQLLSKC